VLATITSFTNGRISRTNENVVIVASTSTYVSSTSVWLVDHQMNLLVRERFGTYFARILLTATASIHHDNALTLDWESVIPKNELNYILGNPAFLNTRVMSKKQKAEVNTVFDNLTI
jgi:hypothetical protein